MRAIATVALAATVLLGAGIAGVTAQHHGHHGGHAHGRSSVSRSDTPAIRDFKAAHMKMMRDMDITFTGNPEVDFRKHMIPHHQGAVDMSRVALRHAKDAQVRQVAEAIRVAQPREIYEFRSWLATRPLSEPSRGAVRAAVIRDFKAAHAKMMKRMDLPYTGDPDVDFHVQMIPHHQGAIDMARVVLRHSQDRWTRQDAEAIIVAQQYEIYQFQHWLAQRGVRAPAGGRPRYVITTNSYPAKSDDEPGTQGELIGQTWAPSGGAPVQRN